MARAKTKVCEVADYEPTITEAVIGDDEKDSLTACFWTSYLGVEFTAKDVRWMGVLQAVARARFADKH